MTEPPFTVVTAEGQTQVIVPMPLPYVPIPSWLTATDLLAVVLIPLWAIGSVIFRSFWRLEPPPRALFTIAPGRFQMVFVTRETGDRTTFQCDPRKITELRKNQYEKGLWIHVRGETMHTYLQDVDDHTIHSLAVELSKILEANTDKTSHDQVSDIRKAQALGDRQ